MFEAPIKINFEIIIALIAFSNAIKHRIAGYQSFQPLTL